ncbi:MAG: phage holin family protein [Syntrophomonas sp.]
MVPIGVLAMFGQTFSKIFDNHLAQLGGFTVGGICYLVDPGAPLYALWIAVVLDLISRVFAEAKNHGGFYRAAVEGHIRSDKMFQGTAIKIVAYFFMCIIAAQAKYVFHYDAAAQFFGSIVYSILFLVEIWSMAENFQEAGVETFAWISVFSRKKLEAICEGSPEGEERKGE